MAAASPFRAFTCLEHRPAVPPPPRHVARALHCTATWPKARARPKARPLGAPKRPPPFDAAPYDSDADADVLKRGPPPTFGAPRHALFAPPKSRGAD